MKEIYDCLIIGAGPAGMSAALYLKRANKKIMLIDGDIPGGAMNKAKEIANYPGLKKISGKELSKSMFNQIKALDIPYKNDKVNAIINKKDIKEVMFNNEIIKTKYIIIATGRNIKHLNIEGEKELFGKGLSYCALCDGNLYKNKTVALIGDDNIEEEALYLSNLVKELIVITSKKININKANVKTVEGFKVIKFNGQNVISSITLKNEEKEYDLRVDGVFLSIGYELNLDIYKNLNLKMDNNYIVVNRQMKTNISGIYACGDVIKKDVYQITTAVGEGSIAAINILKKLK